MDSLQLIAEPNRRRILGLVWERELSVSEIAEQFESTVGAVSQHLALLREARLVSMRREGNRRYYQANREALEEMWRETLRSLAETIEGGR
ncbi:MAG TPA: metalloregulator ArsR/SmtB family transcription factor [Candidatus Limnocylindria bacterium]|nr:metalloregulator ArsR/SmtB family transcription factor [Candidatus Limnocylindria bacterium]